MAEYDCDNSIIRTKSTLGIDIENGFDAHYINIRGKGDLIKEIKKEAKNAKNRAMEKLSSTELVPGAQKGWGPLD